MKQCSPAVGERWWFRPARSPEVPANHRGSPARNGFVQWAVCAGLVLLAGGRVLLRGESAGNSPGFQAAPGATLQFTLQPSNAFVLFPGVATFHVAAAGSIDGVPVVPSFQWRQLAPGATEWMDINGATGSNYTALFVDCTQSSTQLRCRAAIPGAEAISEPASVYVFADDLYPVRIFVQPQSQLVMASCQATFHVAAEGTVGFPPEGPYYQWFKDDLPIPGATNASYTTPPISDIDNGTQFHVVVSNVCGSASSSKAGLLVSRDVVPPRLVGAEVGPGLDRVTMSFAWGSAGCVGGLGLDQGRATDPYNYGLSGGASVASAEVSTNGRDVILRTSLLREGEFYVVTVNNVKDLSGNVVAPDSRALFVAGTRPPIPTRTARVTAVGRQAVIEWPTGGLLEAADALSGPWQTLTAASSPYLANAERDEFRPPRRFYRVRWP